MAPAVTTSTKIQGRTAESRRRGDGRQEFVLSKDIAGKLN
jgi:hypothetical protein